MALAEGIKFLVIIAIFLLLAMIVSILIYKVVYLSKYGSNLINTTLSSIK